MCRSATKACVPSEHHKEICEQRNQIWDPSEHYNQMCATRIVATTKKISLQIPLNISFQYWRQNYYSMLTTSKPRENKLLEYIRGQRHSRVLLQSSACPQDSHYRNYSSLISERKGEKHQSGWWRVQNSLNFLSGWKDLWTKLFSPFIMLKNPVSSSALGDLSTAMKFSLEIIAII